MRIKNPILAATLMAVAACGGEKVETAQATAAPAQAAPAATTPAPAAPVAAAAPADTADLTEQEILGYTLTLDKVRAAHRSDLEVAKAFAANPALKPQPDMNASSFGAAMLQAAHGSPTILGALRKEGLTPRESMLISMSLMQSVIAAFPEEAQGVTLTARVKPENVEFVRAHKAELDRMRAERAAVKIS